MNARDLERAVEEMGHGCPTCNRNHITIGRAHQDLNAAARKASRRDTPQNLGAVKEAKAALQRTREIAEIHLGEH